MFLLTTPKEFFIKISNKYMNYFSKVFKKLKFVKLVSKFFK